MTTFAVDDPTPQGITPSAPRVLTATDNFIAVPGREYLIIFNNGSGVSTTIKIDDPNSVAPVGSTQFDPDISITIPAGQKRAHRLDGRFMGTVFNVISWTTTPFASVTAEIYGPF